MPEYAGKGLAKMKKISEKNSQTSSRARPCSERKRRAALSAAAFGDITTKPPLFHD